MTGCPRCTDPDAEAAWTAQRATRVAVLEQESHFSVQLTACACGQVFATVFTERVDWRGGEDDQTWLVLPIDADARARLEAAGEGEHGRILGEVAPGHRFLERTFPTGGSLGTRWRDAGWLIGPHD